MKKVLGAMAGILFTVFCIAVLGLLMSFTLGALRKLFPDSFTNQMWGLVLFDIGAMIWGLAFVYKSNSVGQYAAAGIGFITSFIGTLLMVTFEVMTSGQRFVEVGDLGRWVVYGFIIVTAVHAALVYMHHAMDPEVSQKINIGIAKGEVTSEGIRQATATLDDHKRNLAASISKDITDNALRDLGINIAVEPGVGFVPAQPVVPASPPAKKESLIKRVTSAFKRPAPVPASSQQMEKKEQTVVQAVELQEPPEPKQENPPAGDAPFPG